MPREIVLFGAFDRHNLGDLLFPHVAAALLPGRPLRFAGLARHDLRGCGGHAVEALADIAAQPAPLPRALLHVGGEVLDCSAWAAAVMLAPPEALQPLLAHLNAHPAERAAWVRRQVGCASAAPYVAGRQALPRIERLGFFGVGGIGLAQADPELRAEVLARLAEADAVAVRDAQTQAALHSAGIVAQRVPDPAVLVAELFGPRIAAATQAGEVAQLLHDDSPGHLAVQCSAEFGDDATLDALAAQLTRIVSVSGLRIALFRAGAAAWHDDLDLLRRLAERMPAGSAPLVETLDLWSLCALIATSRGYLGSSLHGRVLALAFGRPRLTLRAPSAHAGAAKALAFAHSWEADPAAAGPVVVDVGAAADALLPLLRADEAVLARQARQLADTARRAFEAFRREWLDEDEQLSE